MKLLPALLVVLSYLLLCLLVYVSLLILVGALARTRPAIDSAVLSIVVGVAIEANRRAVRLHRDARDLDP